MQELIEEDHLSHIIQAEMLAACVNGDVEKWSSEYPQRESCRIAERSQLGSERNRHKPMCFGLGK